MRKLGLAFLIALLALTGAIQAGGQAPALRGVIAPVARNATKVGSVGRNVHEIARSALPDHVWAAMSKGERDGFDRALQEVSGSESQMVRNASILRTFVRRPAEVGSEGRTVPFRSDLPNLHIRAPSPAHDTMLTAFARARFRAALELPFDTTNLRVVTLGLSNDFRRSMAGAREFGQALRRAAERPETWARYLTVRDPAERRRLLAPFRGKTIVLVGHVPADRNAFFVFDAAGVRHDINIEGWMADAGAVGVDLVPIGCNSARIASTGVEGLTSTGIVQRGLSRVVNGQPRTVGQFFGHLTGDELRLVIDPLETRLFGGGIAIETRGTRQPIGRILWRDAAPIWPRVVRAQGSDAVPPGGGSAGEGATPGGEASPTPDPRQVLRAEAQQLWERLAAVHCLTWLGAMLFLLRGLRGVNRAGKARGRWLRLLFQALLIVSLLALAGAAYFATFESAFILLPLILGGMLLPVVVADSPRQDRRALWAPLAALLVAGIAGTLLLRQNAEIARIDARLQSPDAQAGSQAEPQSQPRPSRPAPVRDGSYDPTNSF